MTVYNEVWRQIRELRKESRAPVAIRLGEEDYYEAVTSVYASSLAGPFSVIYGPSFEIRLFGVPVQRVPLRHVVSVVT